MSKILQSSLFVMMVVAANNSIAQDNSKDKQASAMQKVLESKHYIFTAQSVTPSRGGFRQLTTTYDLKVSSDSLICALPYFGRAYTAPIDPSAGGYNFTSTSFNYDIKPRKKNGWDVSIKPNDFKDIQQIFLNVFPNGTASLMITSNNKEPITFNGNVK